MINLYKKGALKWDLCDTYETIEAMIEDLITTYGVDELIDCDKDCIVDILDDWEYKYEYFTIPKIMKGFSENPIKEYATVLITDKSKEDVYKFIKKHYDTSNLSYPIIEYDLILPSFYDASETLLGYKNIQFEMLEEVEDKYIIVYNYSDSFIRVKDMIHKLIGNEKNHYILVMREDTTDLDISNRCIFLNF